MSDILDVLNYRVGGAYYATLPEAKASAREDVCISAQEGQDSCRQVIDVITGKVVCQYLSIKGVRKHKVIMRTP